MLTTSCLALSIAAAVALAWPPALAAAQSARQRQDTITISDTAEDIEIMRLVLVRVLKEQVNGYIASIAPAEDAETAPEPAGVPSAQARGGGGGLGVPLADGEAGAAQRSLLRAYARGVGTYATAAGRGGQVTSNTRGFYAEELGAIFSTEVSVPVREIETATEGDSEADLWRDAEREHHGRGSAASPFVAAGRAKSRFVIDDDAVDVAIDAVIAAIGDYGANIKGLAGDESIVVAMHFEGNGAGFAVTTPPGATQWYSTISGAYGGSARATAVVRISVADVQQYADGKYNRKTLRSRATVTKY
jgi:hypothetical protein